MSNKEELPRLPLDELWNDEFLASLDQQKVRARDLLEQQRRRLAEVQQQLNEQLAAAAEDLRAAGDADADADAEQRAARRRELDERSRELHELQAQLEQRRQQWEEAQNESIRRQQELLSELREQTQGIQRQREELEQRREALAAEQAEFAAARARIEARQEQLDSELRELNDTRQVLEITGREQQQHAAELERQKEGFARERDSLEERARQQQAESARLEGLQAELAAESAALSGARNDLETQQRALAEAEESFRRREAELAGQAAEAERVAEAARELAERQQKLEERETEIAELESRTQAQRKAFAREFRARRHELQAEIERRRAEVLSQLNGEEKEAHSRVAEMALQIDRLRDQLSQREQRIGQLEGQLTALQQKFDRQLEAAEQQQEAARKKSQELQAELQEARRAAEAAGSQSEETEGLRKKLAAAEARITDLRAEAQQRDDAQSRLTEELMKAREAAQNASHNAGGEEEALQELRAECEHLRGQLEAALAGGREGSDQQVADLERRCELALEELREVKRTNKVLQEKLTAAQAARAAEPSVVGGGQDWESQKRRLLAQLESDSEGETPEQARERLSIEKAIATTEQAVAARDAEIAELRQMLEQQSGQIGDMAVGAHAIAQMLNQDELVQQERESLKRLQEEWQQKLRQAEVDISVERAKLARQRSEIDELRRTLEANQNGSGDPPSDSSSGSGKKGSSRRWLSRLGLGEGES